MAGIFCAKCEDWVTPCDACRTKIHKVWHDQGNAHIWRKYCTCSGNDFSNEFKEGGNKAKTDGFVFKSVK